MPSDRGASFAASARLGVRGGELAGEGLGLLGGEVLVGLVIPLDHPGLAVGDDDDPVGHLVEEVAVVRDDEDRPLELADRPFEGVAGPDVEVVRRLVHDQQVGRGGRQPGQRGLALLAAGELADVVQDEIAGEAEPGEEVADVPLDPVGVVLGPDGAEDGGLGRERFEPLVVVADQDLVAELDLARVGRDLADQGLDQRRLPRAVRAEDADALAAEEREVEVLEQAACRTPW